VLVYDGDCGFCRRSVRVLQRIGPDADMVPWQSADLAGLGLTEVQAADAVQWVAADGAISSGHAAIAAALITARGVWRIVGRVMLLPGISWIGARVYRLVADNRSRIPTSRT
jgi:predicted DCC family thiol-disulfide oxidoreductase YuxK